MLSVTPVMIYFNDIRFVLVISNDLYCCNVFLNLVICVNSNFILVRTLNSFVTHGKMILKEFLERHLASSNKQKSPKLTEF